MSIVYLGTCKGNGLRELADQVDAGEVSHCVIAYRHVSGDTRYRLIGADDLTYLVGLLERTKVHLHCADAYVVQEKP